MKSILIAMVQLSLMILAIPEKKMKRTLLTIPIQKMF